MSKILILLVSTLLVVSCSIATAPSNTSTSSWAVDTSKMIDAPMYGSGKHTIEYFGDFQCPACIRFSHTFLPILEEFAWSGKLVIIYKQFPLIIPHKNAYRDSIAALCSAEQGKYMSYKKSLIALEESKTASRWTVSDTERIDATKDMGIDIEKFTQCLKEDRYKSSVDRDMKDGDDKRVNATPTLILDGTKLDLSIFRDENMFRDQISRLLAQ